MSVDPVRRVALRILVAVDAGAPLDRELETGLAGLPARRDRDFLAELVRGSERLRARYDHLIRKLSRRPGARRPPALQGLLRLSLHQLVAMSGVPAYAAVHQAAELCRAEVSPALVPYVNALLQGVARRLAAGGAAGAGSGPARAEASGEATGEGSVAVDRAARAEAALAPLFPSRARDPAGWLATWESHPRWLVERWLKRWGEQDVAALCVHDNRPAPLTLHVLAGRDPIAAAVRLEESGWASRPGALHPRALVLAGRPGRRELRDLLAAEPGLIVQDEGAQAATAWLAAGGGEPLVDLCAAPGGKTFHLRALWPQSALVAAIDRERARLVPLLETAKRIEAAPVAVLLADGEAAPLRPASCGAVLLDGPCSGTGVLRHHPEGRWRLGPARLSASAARLQRLGLAAAAALAPGGRLLYVTCSLEPEENGEVVRALLAAGVGLEPDPHPDPAAAGAWEREWLPQATGTDGFYAARLRRRKESA